MPMTSSRPYIMRALYEWIVDNGCTPYVVVNALADNTIVPEQYINDGQIILNVSPTAVRNLMMDNDLVVFDGRFGGSPMQVSVPALAIMAIYAKENGQGMVFDSEASEPVPEPPSGSPVAPKSKSSSKPYLKVVK